jgi:hypothetical protein
MRLASLLAVTLAGSLSLLSACADTTPGTPAGPGPARVAPPGADPSHPRQSHCPDVSHRGHAAVDYVDFLQANQRQYLASIPAHEKSRKVAIATLQFRVRCDFSQLNDRTHRATPRPVDGDAGFLRAGTAVYSIKRWPPSCRLAARQDGRWRVYVAEGRHIPTLCSHPQ